MGFFDFLKGKEEVPGESQDIGSVELGNVKEKVKGAISSDISRERERVRELYSKIKEDFREVKKLNNELSGKEFKSGQRVDAPVNMIKDNYVRKTLSLLNNIPAVSTFEHKEITDFCSSAEKILKNLRDLPPKQTVMLSKYFKGETSRIIRTLKGIEERRKEMESLLRGKGLWLEGEISSRVEGISGLIKKSKDLERQEETLRGKIRAKEKEWKEKERELKELVSGKDYRGFEGLGSEIEKLDKERMETESELREELSGVKRPLKKLEYSLKQEGGKSALSRVAHSPMKTLFQEQGDSLLMEALVKLRDLNLKDNEKERVEELIKKVELGYLSKLKDRYKFLESEIREKKGKEEKSDVMERKKAKEREMENLKREILEHGKEREKIARNREGTSKSIGKEKKELEETLHKEINIKLNIIV
jgi:hypothetical protein